MKSALRSLNKANMPRTVDEVSSFLGSVNDEKYGLGIAPVTLADVMSYQDDPGMKDFDFFETYYNSPAAEHNRKRSEELFDKVYNLDDDEKALLDQLAFSTATQIAKSFGEQVEAAEAAKSEPKPKDKKPNPDSSVKKEKPDLVTNITEESKLTKKLKEQSIKND